MATDNLEHIDLDNPEFQDAWSVIQKTRRSVFLTGKAGTGKSTFLKYICANTRKKYVVLAPTGIAAVNVGGQTMHSFFKIPFKPLLPDDPDIANISRLRKMLRYTKEKVKLIKELELIIIDEISMVRADVIDFVDRVLRVFSGNMREPFGGKQLLLVGDIFQLEPVVTHDMRDILRRYYKNFFFFNARAFELLSLVAVELRKIYRQSDNQFIALLDRVRINRATAADIACLNQRCNPYYQEVGGNNDFAVTLATRRDTVDSINDEHMQALKTPEFTYEGMTEGDFPENSLPTARHLVLKVGAQVIFIRNDKEGRWYNGTIGIVTNLTDDKVFVALETGEEMEVLPEIWENMQYTYNEKEKKVEEKVLGTFVQIPLKPAWALTVHKSQGLTFNHVVIDFVGGAFTGGQTYVALSRCTSLEGITLLKPLSERDIIVNLAVVDFSRQFNNRQIINDAMEQERANMLYRRAVHAFDHHEFEECVKCFTEAMKIKDNIQDEAVKRLIVKKLNTFKKQLRTIERLQEVIDSQQQLLRELALEYSSMGDQALAMDGVVGEGSTPYGSRHDDIAIRSALANYNKALRIMPDCVPAMIGKAKLMITLDQMESAEEELAKALAVDKNCYPAHLTMGELKEQQRDVPEAIKCYKRAAKSDKKRPEPHERLQDIYERIGLDDLAEEEQETASRLRKALAKQSAKKKKKK